MGIQKSIHDSWIVRAGYNYGSNPIGDDITFYNVGTPQHNEHHLALGASWMVSRKTAIDVGYTHAFESSQSGSWYDATGQPIGQTNIHSSLAYDQISVGFTHSF